MSVMSDMLADILKKALPPELMEMLTPENIKALGEKVNAFLIDHKEQIDRIEEKLEMVLNRVMPHDIAPQIEETENVSSNDSVTGSGKRPSNRRGKPGSVPADNG